MANPLAGLFDQIENFLFDLLGIVLPGFIFLLILATPIFLVGLPSSIITFRNTPVVRFVQETSKWLQSQPVEASFYALLLISFILGHVIKVFSKVWYDLLKSIFDDTVNIYWMKGVRKIGITNRRFDSKKGINPILYAIVKQLTTIFTFSSPNYYKENAALKDEAIINFNKYFDAHFKEEVWYSLYKLSKIVNTHENIRSLAYTYLAKYNFYRSIAFIVALNLIYDLIIISNVEMINGVRSSNFLIPIFLINGIFWFTFHEKYKRYWTLCGDETLMAFYYFTLRKKTEK